MTRKRVEITPGHVGVIAGHYVLRGGGRLVSHDQEWMVWICPRCGRETYKANLGWGKAGCINPQCPIPQNQKWSGIVAHHEELDARDDIRKVREIALGIVAEHVEVEHRKAEERRRSEQERARGEQEARERAEAEAMRRRTARNEKEQRLLDEHRAEEKRVQAEEERTRSDRERVEREERHERALTRALLARAPVLPMELLLGAVVGAVLASIVYLGIGWLESFAAAGRPTNLETFGLAGVGPARDDTEVVSRARDFARHNLLPVWAVAHRLPLVVAFGLSISLVACWALGRGRRVEHAFDEGEYVGTYQLDRSSTGQTIWVETTADRRELWLGPVLRFGRGSLVPVQMIFAGVVMFFELVAAVAAALQVGEWPWARFGAAALAAVAAVSAWAIVLWIDPQPYPRVLAVAFAFSAFVFVLMKLASRGSR